MPARKPRPKDEKPQFERFIETARKVEADETDETLERALDEIAPPRLGKPVMPSAPHSRRNGKRRAS